MKPEETIYGLMAEFATPEQLLEAARHTHDAGYRRIDAFAPFPIEGLAHAIGFHRTRLPSRLRAKDLAIRQIDLGGGLGVTDPVSGEVVLSLGS